MSANYRETNIGVSQRSVLDPLLYCLHVNDLQTALGNDLVLQLLYADYFKVFIQILIEMFHEGLTRLTKAARTVADWVNRNSLTVSNKKPGLSYSVGLSSSYTVGVFDSLDYPGNQIAKRVNCALLGLRFI